MAARYLEGRLPRRADAMGLADEPFLRGRAEETGGRTGEVARAWREWRTHAALAQVLELVSATNEYLERLEPWKRAKDPAAAAEVAATLLHAAEAVRLAAALLWPVVPELSGRILESLGQPAVPRPEDLAWGILDGEETLAVPPIYQRLEAGAV
jgi:methionyl-tRNA synthetase